MCTYVAFQLAVRILETDTNNVYIMLKHQLYLSVPTVEDYKVTEKQHEILFYLKNILMHH